MSGRMASVRRFYGIPAKRGAQVTFRGYEEPMRGTIISSTGSHLYIRLASGKRFGPLHPTWEMDYGDGRDYTAETNARIAAFNRAVNALPRTEESDV
jgi:hypothetical protein